MAAMDASPQSKSASVALFLMTGCIYIGISAGLIAFNQRLMAPDMFPYPAALGLLHSVFCSAMAGLLYLVRPGLFTSLNDPEKKIGVRDAWKAVLPIAVFFVAQIVLSNQAYKFADIAFLQMLKECNVVMVYLMTVTFALEVFKWRQMKLIGLIVIATWLTVTGDLTFKWAAIAIAFLSCVAESSKITLQGLLLTSAGKGLDAFSYMLLVMPMSACIFAGTLLFFTFSMPDQQVLLMPAPADWFKMRWLLLANACVALALNIAIVVFIKCSSAVAFVLAGIIKDVFIVCLGVWFMGHKTTALQVFGFTMQVGLILVYSLTKTFPKEFEHGMFHGLEIVLLGKTLKTLEPTKQDDYGTAQERDSRLPGYTCPEVKDNKV